MIPRAEIGVAEYLGFYDSFDWCDDHGTWR